MWLVKTHHQKLTEPIHLPHHQLQWDSFELKSFKANSGPSNLHPMVDAFRGTRGNSSGVSSVSSTFVVSSSSWQSRKIGSIISKYCLSYYHYQPISSISALSISMSIIYHDHLWSFLLTQTICGSAADELSCTAQIVFRLYSFLVSWCIMWP